MAHASLPTHTFVRGVQLGMRLSIVGNILRGVLRSAHYRSKERADFVSILPQNYPPENLYAYSRVGPSRRKFKPTGRRGDADSSCKPQQKVVVAMFVECLHGQINVCFPLTLNMQLVLSSLFGRPNAPPSSAAAHTTRPCLCLQMINYGFKKIEGRGPDEVSRVVRLGVQIG